MLSFCSPTSSATTDTLPPRACVLTYDPEGSDRGAHIYMAGPSVAWSGGFYNATLGNATDPEPSSPSPAPEPPLDDPSPPPEEPPSSPTEPSQSPADAPPAGPGGGCPPGE